MILIGFQVSAAVEGDSMDEAFKDAITRYGPQLEVAMGLMGLRRVTVAPTFARRPLEGEA